MTAAPPTGRGGSGAKPPDPPDERGRRAARDEAALAAKTKDHSVPKENSGGPLHGMGVSHQRDNDQQRPPSALVTTPSDAQGEGGARQAEQQDVQQSADGRQTHSHPQPAATTVSYAAAVRNSGDIQPIDATPTPRTIAGHWKPRERHLLLRTLDKEWHVASAPVDSAHHATLRQAALATSEVRDDSSLRPLTATETETLLAFLNGELELPHAPKILKATWKLLQRAMLEQFHESHVEVLLTADVTPAAKLRI